MSKTAAQLISAAPDINSEVRLDESGRLTVPVITERQHFERQLQGMDPSPVDWPAHLVWVE